MRIGEQPPRSDVLPTPPEPPAEFKLLRVPVPLLTVYDERWIVQAAGPEGVGYLIYEEFHQVVFLPADEAIVALAVMSEELRSWIDQVNPEVSAQHGHLVDEVRGYWHMLAREHQSQQGQGEGEPQ